MRRTRRRLGQLLRSALDAALEDPTSPIAAFCCFWNHHTPQCGCTSRQHTLDNMYATALEVSPHVVGRLRAVALREDRNLAY